MIVGISQPKTRGRREAESERKDGRVISLIHKYLNAGIVSHGLFEPSGQGTPLGSPISPLLGTIMLYELDKELERRGHPFVRYADDALIFCKTQRAAALVKDSITEFIELRLRLKVNRDKTVVSYVSGVKYLGYSFYIREGKSRLSVHTKSKAKTKSVLKTLTSRSNGWGYDYRNFRLRTYISGWINYYHLADMKTYLERLDEWLRRRIRMYIWKLWKLPRIANLIKCGIDKYRAYMWGNTRKGYWCVADSPEMHQSLTNLMLK